MNKINNIAIIIARGGSKRIPKKNIKLFLGKPIIDYSIKTALKCDFFDEVIVSTDDNEIENISKVCGAKVPFLRSPQNSTDLSTTADVIYEVINCYKSINIIPKYVCCIYPTAPFLNSKTLKKAFEILKKNKVKSVIPVTKFSYPIQRSLVIKNEMVKMKWHENMNKRSQDLDEFYHDVGQFYFLKVKPFLKEKLLFTDSTSPLVIPSIFAQDIDNLDDWSIAEFKYSYLKKNNLL